MSSARSLSSIRPPVADKREAILRAATRVFARNGYSNSKVADIAGAAGVADGTVYLYFKSKEEILHSIFDRSVDNAVERSCAASRTCTLNDSARIVTWRLSFKWSCAAPQNSWRSFQPQASPSIWA
jgi:AcrR family transcriptional regulator